MREVTTGKMKDPNSERRVVRELRACPSLGIEGNGSGDRLRGPFLWGTKKGVVFRKRRFALEECIPAAVCHGTLGTVGPGLGLCAPGSTASGSAPLLGLHAPPSTKGSAWDQRWGASTSFYHNFWRVILSER